MKTNLKLRIVLGSLLLLVVGGSPLRAADAPASDVNALVSYADQLHDQGINGRDFTDKVNQRADELAQKSGQADIHGIGAFVLQQQAQGLHGASLAEAIHTELIRRDVGKGNGKPGGPDSNNQNAAAAGASHADDRGSSGIDHKKGR